MHAPGRLLAYDSSMMFLRLLLVPTVFFLIAWAAHRVDQYRGVEQFYFFLGVLSGLFALLGVLVGLGSQSLKHRLAIAILASFGLIIVCLWRQNGILEFCLGFIRILVLGPAWWAVRRMRGVVFCRREQLSEYRLQPIKLWHLFAFTFAVALFLGFVRLFKDYEGLVENVVLVIAVGSVGGFGALNPLIVSYAAMSLRHVSGAVPYVVVVLMLAFCLGALGYSQTDDPRELIYWSVVTFVEATVTALGIAVFRLAGYRLGRPGTG